MKINEQKIKKFPVNSYIPEIFQKLKANPTRSLILTAETGAGKSTVLPPGLLQNFPGKILMTEPRRLAVLGVASRVSELVGENCGKTVGYKIHLESKISEETRLEIMTEAVLVRILQENPALEGYEIVILDEAHERSVNFDLALAFLKEAMEIRDDLYVVVMSATINCKKLSEYFGNCPVISIPGRTFPVEVSYSAKMTVEQAVISEFYNSRTGNLLVFLPGISEIKKCYENLTEKFDDEENSPEIFILHSSISLDEQKKILKPAQNQKRRIILSSAIAETSLTVPDVTVVIDSGFSRVMRTDLKSGMQTLVTERESEFSAEQRKGRAGRLQKGKCIRLWSEFDVRVKELEPEILRTELSELVLECADRGITQKQKLLWLDSPSDAQWNESVFLLQNLEFLNSEGKITERGRIALKLGMHPRLANVAVQDFINQNDSKLGKTTAEILIKYGNYKRSPVSVQNQFLNDLEKRLKNIDFSKLKTEIQTKNTKYPVLAGFPDRLAKRLTCNGNAKAEYQFPNGKLAVLVDSKKTPQWIVAPEVLAGSGEAKIFEFEEIDENFVQNWLQNRLKTEKTCEFENGKIKKAENLCFGKIVVFSKNIAPETDDYKFAWCTEVEKKGLGVLPSNKKISSFLDRAAFYSQQKNEKSRKIEDFLRENVKEWLPPFVNSAKLSEENIYDALYWFLKGAEIDLKVPEILILPNGNRAKVKYENLASPEDKNKTVIRPVIEIVIQRIFGCFETPEIFGMKVLLRLLSPAQRPLQITDDLNNFWQTTWPEICKEMKGRYPKHNWEYKIVQKD